MDFREILILLFIFFQGGLGLLLIGRFLVDAGRSLRSKTGRREAKNPV
jgi:hypothetical protein